MPKERIQQSFVQQQLHNETVKNNIQHIQDLVHQQTYQQLIQSLHQWSHTPPVLTVTNTLFWTLISIGLFLGILMLFFALPIWLLLLPLAIVIFAFIKKENNKNRDALFAILKQKVLEEKYHIQFNTTMNQYDIDQLQHNFPLFSRGNHENYIAFTATGNLDIEQQNFPFTIFQYHYVDESQDRDKDGNVSYSYTHYDRWGIFIDNMSTQGLSISNDQTKSAAFKMKWTTSDIQFNKKFKLSGQDEMQLARFFSPARVLLLDEILGNGRMDLYFHPNLPILCWQFQQDIFHSTPKRPSIHTIHQLAEHLEKLQMPELEDLQQKLSKLLEKVS